jgi:uncharacterized protein YecE (DUF72 family)
LNPRLHIGTMGWSYGFWKGSFYPEELASKNFLNYYSKRFNSVEVNSTFYRIPRGKTIIEWDKSTPQGFKFSLKFPQKITHVKMLQNCEDETKVFLERAILLEEKLGVLLLQFPPTFGSKNFPLLVKYLKNLPRKFHYTIEVRNKSLLNDDFYALLREGNVALTWVDTVKMSLVTELTADFIYVRWEGDRSKVRGIMGTTEVDQKNNIQSWAHKLNSLKDKDIYGYYSKYYSGFPPQDCLDLLKEIQLAS